MTLCILTIVAALLLDRAFGEVRHFHPLVGFGQFSSLVERLLFRGMEFSTRLRGLMGWGSVVIPVVIFGLLLQLIFGVIGVVIDIVGLYFVIGRKSLATHANAVESALADSNIDLARERVGMIVSRDSASLDENGVVKATVESVLENGNDAIFGAIFWFIVAGLPGAFLFRAANTLDAMWGYKSSRFSEFGWFAARVDDLMNWAPARLTALSYALVGATSAALTSWKTQAAECQSPNAGVVMATGAGALEVKLGGAALYRGKLEERPQLGCGDLAVADDISRALNLIDRALLLWLGALLAVTLILQ